MAVLPLILINGALKSGFIASRYVLGLGMKILWRKMPVVVDVHGINSVLLS